MKRFSPLCIAALAFLAACQDDAVVTAPDERGPNLGIYDGNNDDGTNQKVNTPGFFFLPPVAPEPTGNPEFKDSPFNGRQAPALVVEICEVGAPPRQTHFRIFPRQSSRLTPLAACARGPSIQRL